MEGCFPAQTPDLHVFTYFVCNGNGKSIDFTLNAFEKGLPRFRHSISMYSISLSTVCISRGQKKKGFSRRYGINESRVAFRKKKKKGKKKEEDSIVGKDPRRTRCANLV